MKRAIAASVLAFGIGLFTAGAAQAEPIGALTPGGGVSLADVDAKNAAHWQICDVNVANRSVAPSCDNSHGTATGVSDASGNGISMATVDASDAAHWQICGVNVLSDNAPANCDNSHAPSGPVDSSGVSGVNADASGAAHWQVCGVTVAANPADCDNQG